MKCARCGHEIKPKHAWFDVHLIGGSAAFHSRCFQVYLKLGVAESLVDAVCGRPTKAELERKFADPDLVIIRPPEDFDD